MILKMKKIRLTVIFFALSGILSLTNCKKSKNKNQEEEIIQDDKSLAPSTHESQDNQYNQDKHEEKIPETQESEITE